MRFFLACGSASKVWGKLSDIGSMRGLQPVSGCEMLMVLLAISISFHYSLIASPGLAPVSLNVCKNIDI